MSNIEQWFANRFIDDTISNDAQLTPIYGYQSQPIVSLEKALESIQSLIENLFGYMKVAEENCYYPNKYDLTKDQSASIYLYTMEWGNHSFYRVLNTALRTEDRTTLKPWFAFLKLFDSALKKLPLLKQNIWRGVRSALGQECKKGDELIWWSINSCSSDVHVIEHFLCADSTLFLIEAINARDISGYTNYPSEHEVILPPGIRLEVVANSVHHTGGLHIVHLRETKLPEHSEFCLSISLGQNETHPHETTQAKSLQSKITIGFHQTRWKKTCLMIGVVLILGSVIAGVTIRVVSKNKNVVSTIQPQDNPTTMRFTLGLLNSSITTPNFIITNKNHTSICSAQYPPDGFQFCQQWTQVRLCQSGDCKQTTVDCYVTSKVFADRRSSNIDIWYRSFIQPSVFIYLTGVLCVGGDLPHCWSLPNAIDIYE